MRRLLPLLLLLTGCATEPVVMHQPTQLDIAFAFNGRVSVKQGSQRDSAGVRWVHQDDDDEILLLAPLGKTVARIRRDANRATLEASGKGYIAQDMESLMQQALGWHLPLNGLRYWVTALPAPDGKSTVERNAHGQLRKLRQQGWEISYSRYAETTAEALPMRLSLKREGMEVQVVIDEWERQ